MKEKKMPKEIVQLFMKILITAMAVMAETGGPVSRSIALAKYLKNAGHQVATRRLLKKKLKTELDLQVWNLQHL